MAKSLPDSISPTDALAQQNYLGVGNPPASHPSTAVGNFFPGLEFNFQNVWKRVFKGIELLESTNQVIAVSQSEVPTGFLDELIAVIDFIAEEGFTFAGLFLDSVDGKSLTIDVTGPKTIGGQNERLSSTPLEWSNSLSRIHFEKAIRSKLPVLCKFSARAITTNGLGMVEFPSSHEFTVNSLVENNSGLISKSTTLAGEITESLCSPWQTDYIGCACYYWASNRPDYVNITDENDAGNHWLNPDRVVEDGKPFYSLRPEENLKHEDVMQDWESKFQFVVGGKDVPDGVVPNPAAATGDDSGVET